MPTELPENELVKSIVGTFFDVFNYFGYGLSETLYMAALEHKLCLRGHAVVRELRVPIYHKDRRVGWQRLDLVVDGKVIVEAKAGEKLPPPSRLQILTYLHIIRGRPAPPFWSEAELPAIRSFAEATPVHGAREGLS
jgi:GxxExxY protein